MSSPWPQGRKPRWAPVEPLAGAKDKTCRGRKPRTVHPLYPGGDPQGGTPEEGGTPPGSGAPRRPDRRPLSRVLMARGGVRPCPWTPRVGLAHGWVLPTGKGRCPREGTDTHGRGLTAASCLSFAPFSTGQGFSTPKCLRPVDFCRGIVAIDRSLTRILPGSTPQVSFHSRSLLP